MRVGEKVITTAKRWKRFKSDINQHTDEKFEQKHSKVGKKLFYSQFVEKEKLIASWLNAGNKPYEIRI